LLTENETTVSEELKIDNIIDDDESYSSDDDVYGDDDDDDDEEGSDEEHKKLLASIAKINDSRITKVREVSETLAENEYNVQARGNVLYFSMAYGAIRLMYSWNNQTEEEKLALADLLGPLEDNTEYGPIRKVAQRLRKMTKRSLVCITTTTTTTTTSTRSIQRRTLTFPTHVFPFVFRSLFLQRKLQKPKKIERHSSTTLNPT